MQTKTLRTDLFLHSFQIKIMGKSFVDMSEQCKWIWFLAGIKNRTCVVQSQGPLRVSYLEGWTWCVCVGWGRLGVGGRRGGQRRVADLLLRSLLVLLLKLLMLLRRLLVVLVEHGADRTQAGYESHIVKGSLQSLRWGTHLKPSTNIVQHPDIWCWQYCMCGKYWYFFRF